MSQHTKEYYAEYRRNNRNHLIEYKRQWNAKNADRLNDIERKKYWSDPEEARKIRMIWHQKVRLEVISLLGNQCVICGFSDWRALQIDHIEGGGAKERKTLSHSPTAYLKAVIESIKAEKLRYQLLCANCNWIKRYENKEQYYG